MICCVIVVGIEKRCFTGCFCRVVEKEVVLWAIQIYSKEIFLAFEMSLDVEAIIVPKDSQYVVVRNLVIKDRWILIL